MILFNVAIFTAHALLRCDQDFCPDVPLRNPQSPAPPTTDNLPATYDFSADVFCSDSGRGDTTCEQWAQLPPNAINNYQVWSIDLTLTQTSIDHGFWLEAPSMRVDICTATAPGAGMINCDAPWLTWMGVPGWIYYSPNPATSNFTPSPYTLADARAVWVRIWVNNADIHASLNIHARRPHVNSFGFNPDNSQICLSATNALAGVTVTGPDGGTIGGNGGGLATPETCADTAGAGDYTISASGPGPGLNGSPPATVKLTQNLVGGAQPSNHFGCGTNNTCVLLNGPPPDTDGCDSTKVGQACGGTIGESGAWRCGGGGGCLYDANLAPGTPHSWSSQAACNASGECTIPTGGGTQCNPPKWDGWSVDGCWDSNGVADCSKTKNVADALCQTPVCKGTSAQSYDINWGANGTKYWPTGRVCPGCSLGFTNLICNGGGGGGGYSCNSNNSCVSDPNSSQSLADCQKSCGGGRDTHLDCVNNTCTRLPGGGGNSCSPAGSRCGLGDTHFGCQGSSCVSLPGAGTNDCSACNSSGPGTVCVNTDTSSRVYTVVGPDQTWSWNGTNCFGGHVTGDYSVSSPGVPVCPSSAFLPPGGRADFNVNQSCTPRRTTHNTCTSDGSCVVVNGAGSDQCQSATEYTDCPQPPPTCTFSSNYSTIVIPPPKQVTLTWSCTGRNVSCSVSPDPNSCSGPAANTCSFYPQATQTYTLTCSNRGGTFTANTKVRAFTLQGGSLKETAPSQ